MLKRPPPSRDQIKRRTDRKFGSDEFDPRLQISPKPSINLSALHAINERCLKLLVEAAQGGAAAGGFPLVRELRELLSGIGPGVQIRAARCPVLLVDMQFANTAWWRVSTEQPTRAQPLAAWQGAFPRSAGSQLAFATLSLAWHIAHAAPHQASLLGMTADVSAIVGSLPITEIKRVAEKRFKHVRPRWEDRPAIWRRLLLSAQTESLRLARDFSLYSLQLITSDVLSPVNRSVGTS